MNKIRIIVHSILILIYFITSGSSCTRVTPPIPIATAGQNSLIEKQQIEITSAIGENFISVFDDNSTASAVYGRIRYGITDKFNIAIDGIKSNSEYNSLKIGSQYRPFKFLVIDGGLGRGYGKSISSTGISLGLTADIRFVKSGKYGIFSSVRSGHNFLNQDNSSLPHNQRLFCFGSSGYLDKKKHLYWFIEIGDIVHHKGSLIANRSLIRNESYFGMGLSYRFRIPKKKS